MATKFWMARDSLAECERLAKAASDFLAGIEDKGGEYRETHIAMTEYAGNPIVLLTIIYEDNEGEPDIA